MLPCVTAEALHQALLASDSATAVLERLFGAPVSIRRLKAVARAPDRLPPGPGVVHRAVSLHRGDRLLSEADLWFLPELLPPAMVEKLAVSDAPFGRVVQALGLRRHTLSARLCAPGEPFALEHNALLHDAAGRDVAEVAERYCWGLVGRF